MRNKTFRLFISSTFSDFTGEREILQLEVFPQLEKYCSSHGYQFQAIDLRWGVMEEAQVDQKTIEICLNEVKICKHYPHPNFLIMLGDRYGWVPLPYAIERAEFERILDYYSTDTLAKDLLLEWYQLDENHIMNMRSVAYVIKARMGEYLAFEKWEKIENHLRKLLQDASLHIGNDINKQKYYISATEREVNEGMYPYRKYSGIISESKPEKDSDAELDMEYVYGFIREINSRTQEMSQSVYFDANEERLLRFKTNLRKTLLKENLLELKTSAVDINKIKEDYLEIFRDHILKYLKSSITQQLNRIAQGGVLEKAKREHYSFLQERIKIFVGQHEVLENIEGYIKGSSLAPLIIHAESGMGKTSLMAKAIDHTNKASLGNVIYRFVGASENSANIRGLLISILREIDTKVAEELQEIYNAESFDTLVEKTLSEINSPTIVFIDALDQLQEKTYLKWLPNKLPTHLKVVISILEDKDYRDDSTYLNLFKVKYSERHNQNNFVQLKALTRVDGDKILTKLLSQINRSITKEQRAYALDKFEKSGFSPLFLIISFEEIKKWKSFDSNEDKKLEDHVVASIKTFLRNLSEVYHHQSILVRRTMGYLECAKNGLSEKEIIDVLSDDKEVLSVIENQFHKNLSNKMPIAPWARLYSHMSPFFIEKMSDNVSLIMLFHRQFKNAVQTEMIDDIALRQKLHFNLAQYLKAQDLVSTEGVYNLRKLSEYAYQLIHSNQVGELINLFEQDYIAMKHHIGKLYECLAEIEETYALAGEVRQGATDNQIRLVSSLLQFLDSYSQQNDELFDFELIHAYFIYRMHAKFYPGFLKLVSKKEFVEERFSNKNFINDYYLRFLSGSVGYLRRTAKLQEAVVYVKQLIKEYSDSLTTHKDMDRIHKHLSSSYYELGYIFYLRGKYLEADEAFERSVFHAQEIHNEISEWITKCVKARVAYYGGIDTIDDFDSTLDQAYNVFKRLASTNHNAKRWIKVTYDHKFEVANIKSDVETMRKYYNILTSNQWNKEHDVAMELHRGLLELVEGKAEEAIQSIREYLHTIQEEKAIKEESVTRIYFYLGLAYYKNGDINQARKTWENVMSMDDEPGNHAFKRMTREQLLLL